VTRFPAAGARFQLHIVTNVGFPLPSARIIGWLVADVRVFSPATKNKICGIGVDYQLKTIGKTCTRTGKDLTPGETCHCVVVERDGQFVRLDFSEDGWEGTPAGTVGEWTTIVPEVSAKPQAINFESLMRYFEQLCEDANPGHDQMRYVLALLLLQKRRLRLEGSRTDDDGNEYLQLIGSKSEGPFEVVDQQLDETQIAQLQSTLNRQMESEWN
jgi:hypothetical protein